MPATCQGTDTGVSMSALACYSYLSTQVDLRTKVGTVLRGFGWYQFGHLSWFDSHLSCDLGLGLLGLWFSWLNSE